MQIFFQLLVKAVVKIRDLFILLAPLIGCRYFLMHIKNYLDRTFILHFLHRRLEQFMMIVLEQHGKDAGTFYLKSCYPRMRLEEILK